MSGGLTPTVLAPLLMLLSAAAHAVIGAVMKSQSDKLVFRGVLGLTCALTMLPFTALATFPPAEVWMWLGLGAALHFAYQLSQVAAFDRGDMGLVYPIMRGTAPAGVALFAYFILNEPLSPLTLGGLIIVVASIIGFSWQGLYKSIGGLRGAIAFAVTCGALTAAYTVVDAKGIRLSGDSLGYLVWFFLIDGLGIALITAAYRGKAVFMAMRSHIASGVFAGLLSLISYGAALIALSMAPAAKLAAIRETSVIFGAILAALWLKESFGARRITLACVLAFGLILMQMG